MFRCLKTYLLVFGLAFFGMFQPAFFVYAEDAVEEGTEEEYAEDGEYEEEGESEEGGEYYEDDGEYAEDEYYEESFDSDALLDEVFDEGGGDGEYQDPTQASIDNVLDLLERHQGIQLLPEQFIYPFSPEHQPMLANNLVASVQGDGPAGFRSKSIKKDEKKSKKHTMGSKNAGGIGRIIALGPDMGSSNSSSASGSKDTVKGAGGKGLSLPDFEITGKFGTKDKEYIVIGNRYYTLEQRLKGSRALRKVRLIGIDDTMAYFQYKDTTFPKKIKALERIF